MLPKSHVPVRSRVLIVLSLLLVAADATPVPAWNETGHRISALVAYGQLDVDIRAKIIAVLRKHERFGSDFLAKMPQEISEGDEDTQNTWIFLHAATWPDLARSFRGEDKARFHHPTWHYINEPVFLSKEQQTAMGDVRPNLHREWSADTAPDDMNIIQALKKCIAELSDGSTSDGDKAIAICWLSHCLGDLHQPMHSTALFTKSRFPEGDRGGNLIPLVKGKNLHALWDGLLGGKNKHRTIQNKVIAYLNDVDLRAAGELAAEVIDFETWLKESHELAKATAYDVQILDAVEAGEDDPTQKLGKIHLPKEYYSNAGAVAKRRVVEAGFRLAEVLERCDW